MLGSNQAISQVYVVQLVTSFSLAFMMMQWLLELQPRGSSTSTTTVFGGVWGIWGNYLFGWTRHYLMKTANFFIMLLIIWRYHPSFQMELLQERGSIPIMIIKLQKPCLLEIIRVNWNLLNNRFISDAIRNKINSSLCAMQLNIEWFISLDFPLTLDSFFALWNSHSSIS